MSVTSLSITQDNISEDGVNLLSVHNPLVFLVAVTWETDEPDCLYVEIQDEEGEVLNTFAAIPYEDDETTSTRTYAFKASKVLKAYMDEFEDFESEENTLEYVEGITQVFTLRFYIGNNEDSVTFVACHAVRQFGETTYMESIYNNVDETYYGGVGMPVYVYFYNASGENTLTIDTPYATNDCALDYDDTPFLDSDDAYFKIL